MRFYSKFLIFFLLTLQVLNAQQTVRSAQVEFLFISKDVDGTIGGFQSSSKINPEELKNSVFEGSVAVETIKTGNFLRDWNLKNSKYFDEETYPLITFKSTEITSNEQGIEVVGTVTIKGISKTLRWKFQRDGNTLRGRATLYSSDFNINIKKGREENKVEINLVLELG